MKDSLGDRMKSNYEDRTRYSLPRRTFTIIRIDGKAFHSYTINLERPFDNQLMNDMNLTAKYLCENIHCSKFAYIQSDEISILLTDFDKLNTDAWFDGNIQKIVSVSSSLATGYFNFLRPGKLAFFDSRVFTLPYETEVENYFLWRQQDCIRNSIQSVAQSLYSHKELKGKNCNQLQEMIFQKNINWFDYEPKYKRGRGIIKNKETRKWMISDVPIFNQEPLFFKDIFPIME